MRRVLGLAFAILSVAYPFLIYWGLQHYSAASLLPFLLLLILLRLISVGRPAERGLQAAILVIVIAIILLWGYELGLKFYPVMINFGMLCLFAASLFYPPSIVERIARLQEPELPPAAIVYTTGVTRVWVVFFIVNGSVAAATAIWASDEVWALYNGFIAYLLIGLLFAGEWLVRRRVMGR